MGECAHVDHSANGHQVRHDDGIDKPLDVRKSLVVIPAGVRTYALPACAPEELFAVPFNSAARPEPPLLETLPRPRRGDPPDYRTRTRAVVNTTLITERLKHTRILPNSEPAATDHLAGGKPRVPSRPAPGSLKR